MLESPEVAETEQGVGHQVSDSEEEATQQVVHHEVHQVLFHRTGVLLFLLHLAEVHPPTYYIITPKSPQTRDRVVEYNE